MSRRLAALVIGNGAYEDAGELENPANDAEDIAAKLETCGFTVIKELDCTFADMDRALKRFKRALPDNDVGLFFFAGHGMQIDGENYLAAVNTDTAGEDEAKYSSLPEPCHRSHGEGGNRDQQHHSGRLSRQSVRACLAPLCGDTRPRPRIRTPSSTS